MSSLGPGCIKHKTIRAGGKSHRFSRFSDADMGNLNLIWDAIVANVECCPVDYEIQRVFTQPGSVGVIVAQIGPAAASGLFC